MRATYSPSTRGMHHISLRQGLRPFSASRRRTVSPDRLSCPVSLTMASASSSSVQRARPLGGLAQFDPITYIHPDLLVGGPDESTNESKIRRRSQPQRSRLHRKARPVPSFHLHLRAHVPTPTRRDRY